VLYTVYIYYRAPVAWRDWHEATNLRRDLHAANYSPHPLHLRLPHPPEYSLPPLHPQQSLETPRPHPHLGRRGHLLFCPPLVLRQICQRVGWRLQMPRLSPSSLSLSLTASRWLIGGTHEAPRSLSPRLSLSLPLSSHVSLGGSRSVRLAPAAPAPTFFCSLSLGLAGSQREGCS
jgi:hypothetical protein